MKKVTPQQLKLNLQGKLKQQLSRGVGAGSNMVQMSPRMSAMHKDHGIGGIGMASPRVFEGTGLGTPRTASATQFPRPRVPKLELGAVMITAPRRHKKH